MRQVREHTFVIDEDANVRFLVCEATQSFVTGDSQVKRASHVEPVNPILRSVFHTLRVLFGEKGRMAEFTRLWPCLWRINLAPIGGPILNYVYWDRQEAIQHEIRYLQEHFL